MCFPFCWRFCSNKFLKIITISTTWLQTYLTQSTLYIPIATKWFIKHNSIAIVHKNRLVRLWRRDQRRLTTPASQRSNVSHNMIHSYYYCRFDATKTSQSITNLQELCKRPRWFVTQWKLRKSLEMRQWSVLSSNQ